MTRVGERDREGSIHIRERESRYIGNVGGTELQVYFIIAIHKFSRSVNPQDPEKENHEGDGRLLDDTAAPFVILRPIWVLVLLNGTPNRRNLEPISA